MNWDRAKQPLAIVGTTIFDGTGSSPLADGVLLAEAGRITAIGPATKITPPPEAQIVNAKGQWLLPGLIDLHTHLDEIPHPGEFLRYGVTTVRDVGSRLVTLEKLRARIARGEAMPRLFWMGRNIDEGKPSWEGAVAVGGPSEIPALIADMQDRQGVDGVKLYVRARPDVARAVIAEAHRRGLPVTGHLEDTRPSVAANLGIDNLEHVFTLFSAELVLPEVRKKASGMRRAYAGVDQINLNSPVVHRLIDTLARHHVAVTPTLSVSVAPVRGERAADSVYAGWADLTPEWRADWKRPYWDFLHPVGWKPTDFAQAERGIEQFQRMVGLLTRAGVPLVAGTDTPAPWVLPGAGLVHELEMMVASGVSTQNALLAATGKAAGVLRRTGEVGTLVRGARADFVLVPGDPLQDIKQLRQIRQVYLGGREIPPVKTKH